MIGVSACSGDSRSGTTSPGEKLDAGTSDGVQQADTVVSEDVLTDVAPIVEDADGGDGGSSKPSCVPGPEVRGYCWVDIHDAIFYNLPKLVETEADLAQVNPYCNAYSQHAMDGPFDFESQYLITIGTPDDCLFSGVVPSAIRECATPNGPILVLDLKFLCCGGYSTDQLEASLESVGYVWIEKGTYIDHPLAKRETVYADFVPDEPGGPTCWGWFNEEWSKVP